MQDLISRVKCPMGCQNSTITERVKHVKAPNSDLLLEGVQTVKVYTCQCCGNTFEITERTTPNGKLLL